MSIDYENILLEIPDAIVTLDNELNVVFANNRFKEVFRDESPSGKIQDYIEQLSLEALQNDRLLEKYNLNIGEEHTPIKVHAKSTNDGYVLLISLVEECICIDSLHMDFVSTVSHELRTPLTSMKGFIDTMLSAGDRLDEAQKNRFLSIVQQQIGRLSRLVEDLLTVSRLEGQKAKNAYQVVRIEPLCELILDSLKLKYPEHTFEMNVSDNISEIWADYDKVQQILTNLIDNGAKYSYPNSVVKVDIVNKHDFVEIAIKDKGVGIPDEYLSQLFNKFARIDNPLTREVQGTGLGLYITKTLIENMGGEISVASVENEGSTFTVLLPVTTAEGQAKQRFVSDAN